MSTSSQKRLLPKPSNFDIFQNDRNEAAKLQRLMPVSQPRRRRQPNKQNEQDKAARRKEEKAEKNRRYHFKKNQLHEENDLLRDFSLTLRIGIPLFILYNYFFISLKILDTQFQQTLYDQIE